MTIKIFYMTAIATTLVFAGFPDRAKATDDDGTICAQQTGDVAIKACTRAIESGKLKGHSLANKYNNRGVEYKARKDYDRAIADYNSAIRYDEKFADAYYNRCLIYNLREDYDRAIADCSVAIKLGPSGSSLSANGSVKLGDEVATSDYYAQRGSAYLGKKDYVHAIGSFDDAIRLNPKNGSAVNRRGQAYEALGDKEHAAADFEKAKQMAK